MNEWISTQERLPAEREWVLAVIRFENGGRHIRAAKRTDGFGWVVPGFRYDCPVTHWMPIPPPPGREGEAGPQ